MFKWKKNKKKEQDGVKKSKELEKSEATGDKSRNDVKAASLNENSICDGISAEDTVAAAEPKREMPGSTLSTPYPFTECPPKILTAYASSVYNANEGRLLTIEMEKVSDFFAMCREMLLCG